MLGIPSCLEGWNDQALISIAASAAMKAGAPQIRQVLTPPDTGIKDLSAYVPDFIKALTTPLTDLEKASGTYQAPIPPRIAMTGTYDEIMAYFEGDQVSPSVLSGGPWCWMTDGLPIVPPTEEAVAAMLKGTTHKPTEELKFGARIGEDRIASIEKIAINAVMAGCKPEYMPVLLAIAEAGPATGYTGDAVQTQTYLVSGPYAQEIGMNYGFAFFTPGNKANTSIQRAAVLMGINLAGVKISVNNGERMGNPVFGDIFSESPLTPWPTLNVQKGYPSDNSILMCCLQSALVRPGIGNGVPSEDLKQLQVGTPEQLVEAFEQMPAGSILFSPDTAKIWKNEYGFQTPLQLKQYIYDNALVPLEWAKRQYYPAGQVVKFPEPDSNGMIRRLFQKKDADSAMEIVVAGGTGPAWGFGPTYTGIISIDKWR